MGSKRYSFFSFRNNSSHPSSPRHRRSLMDTRTSLEIFSVPVDIKYCFRTQLAFPPPSHLHVHLPSVYANTKKNIMGMYLSQSTPRGVNLSFSSSFPIASFSAEIYNLPSPHIHYIPYLPLSLLNALGCQAGYYIFLPFLSMHCSFAQPVSTPQTNDQ